MFDPERIARAECALDTHGARTEETPFGLFLHNPDHPDPAAATKLVMATCTPGEVNALLADLDARCGRLGLRQRVIAGYDEATFETLTRELPPHGFRAEVCWALRRVRLPQHPPNPDVKPWAFVPGSDDRALTIYQRAGLDRAAMAYARNRSRRIGGMEVIAFMDRKAVGVGGWYTVDGVTCLMPVATRPTYQGCGVATAVINFITQHPDLEVSEALILIVPEDGPISLFEQMGFARNNMMWQFVKLTAAESV